MKPFAIQYNDHTSKEATAIIQYCIMEKHPYRFIKNGNVIPDDHTPVGTVEYCLKAYGQEVVPDYYPEWAQNLIRRNVYKTDKYPLGKRVFIKPADRYKRFNGFVTNGGYKGKKRPPYWCSDLVDFKDEWRYYICNGKIIAHGWYWGDEVKMPSAPWPYVEIPEGFCGAMDCGWVDDRLELVEVHHPFACGWYGESSDYRTFAKWISDGWEYMLKQRSKNE